MPRITKRTVDAATPDPVRQLFLWDDEVPGFGLCVKPTGVRSFIIQYRNAEGRSRRMVLGKVGVLTPEQARALARERLADVRRGLDPLDRRRDARDALTVSDLCDWYLREAEQGIILGRAGRRIKPSTLAMDRSRIEQHVRPLLGRRTAASLTYDDFARFQADVAAGKTAKPRLRQGRGGRTTGGNGVAARSLGMLAAIFEHARQHGLLPENRTRGVKKLPDRKSERFLSHEELTVFGAALRQAEQEGENQVGIAAIRLLLLTGFRRVEALGLRWSWIDEPAQCVRFPDTKSGRQVRPIGRAALDLLKRHPRTAVDHVFPGTGARGHFVGLPKVFARLCRQAGIPDASIHALRHTFASVATGLGYSELTIAGMLGQSVPGVTARYAHVPDAALLQATNDVAATIATILANSGKEDGMAFPELLSPRQRLLQ